MNKVFFGLLVLLLVTCLYQNPQVIGWLCVVSGSVVHTDFFRVAVHVYDFLAKHNTNEWGKLRSLHGKALAHQYVWECQEAKKVWNDLFSKQKALQGRDFVPMNQIIDLVDFAAKCEGDPYEAFRLINVTLENITARHGSGRGVSSLIPQLHNLGMYSVTNQTYANYSGMVQNLTDIQFSTTPAPIFES